ncbi:hypothetical protein [Chryseobacterium sp.]|jgi:hypothetical protein|uniref:hypothetical protein n=1 Tax=Chryseobacterium sp. TaxID=1871047 RepID=UPI002845D34B|nr:hypothetical protein [Chryseobacterium sp.]MDR3023082.1 hypothetical protein [Chryseobacterium sp.]
MKTFIFSIALLSPVLAFSQVGIDTANPQATFHIDGAKDNPSTGVPNITQQGNDFVVTSAGNVGIGTTVGSNKLMVFGKAQYTDGSQNTDYILTSDNQGIATWEPLALVRNYATLSTTGVSVATGASNIYTGTFVDIPAGKWQVTTKMILTKGVPTASNETWWVRTSFSDSPSVFSSSPDIISTSKLVSGLLPTGSQYSILTGAVYINNTSGATKRYYYFVNYINGINQTGALLNFGSSVSGESSIVFERIQ